MKNKRFLLGMLAIALAFGITTVGCEGDLVPDAKLNGTWFNEYTGGGGSQTYKFDNGSYEYSMSGTIYSGPYSKGTYHTDDGTINWGKTWQINGAYFVALANYYSSLYASLGVALPSSVEYLSAFSSRWYSDKEYESILKQYGQYTESDTTSVTTYQVSGNTLTLTSTSTKKSDGTVTTSSTTYTKKGGSSSGSSGGSDTISPPTTNQN